MWIDAEGVAHTVAIPDPRDAFAPTLLDAVMAADRAGRDQLTELVEEFLTELYEGLEDAVPTDRLLEVAIPEGTIRDAEEAGGLALVERVREALLQVPDDFRLDALLVMEDLLDGLGDGEADEETPDQ